MAKVGIVIPIYNAEEYLHECIDSYNKQNHEQTRGYMGK